jgi:hypothetical protein
VAVHKKLQATAAPIAKETAAHSVDKGVASLVATSSATKATCGDKDKTVALIGSEEARHSEPNVPLVPNSDAPRVTKKKGNGHIRQCAQSLKRIARLSVKD